MAFSIYRNFYFPPIYDILFLYSFYQYEQNISFLVLWRIAEKYDVNSEQNHKVCSSKAGMFGNMMIGGILTV